MSTQNPQWPTWLDGMALEDGLRTKAYDVTTPQQRACLKNALAFAHAFWGECAHTHRHETNNIQRGFCYARAETPVPWVMYVCGQHYAAPARLAAALMPALLAGVPCIGAFHHTSMPTSRPRTCISVALELVGVEDIFCCNLDSIEKALTHMLDIHGLGRVILLHTGDLQPLGTMLSCQGVPYWEETMPPQLYMHEDHTSAFDADLLRFAHDCTPEVYKAETPFSYRPHALYAPQAPCGYVPALIFAPGMEGCWLHMDIPPMYFRQQYMCAAPIIFRE